MGAPRTEEEDLFEQIQESKNRPAHLEEELTQSHEEPKAEIDESMFQIATSIAEENKQEEINAEEEYHIGRVFHTAKGTFCRDTVGGGLINYITQYCFRYKQKSCI